MRRESESVASEEFSGIFIAHVSEFGFDLAADCSGSGIGTRSDFGEIELGDGSLEIDAKGGALANVEDVENRFLAEELETSDDLFLILRHFHFTQWTLGFEVSLRAQK